MFIILLQREMTQGIKHFIKKTPPLENERQTEDTHTERHS